MAKRKLSHVEEITKGLDLSKNQIKVLEDFEATGGNVEALIRNKTIYQIGNSLRPISLARSFFKEV